MPKHKRRCDPSREVCDYESQRENLDSHDGGGNPPNPIPIPVEPVEVSTRLSIPARVKTKTKEYTKTDSGIKQGKHTTYKNLDSVKNSNLKTQLANLNKGDSLSTVQVKSFPFQSKETVVSPTTAKGTSSTEKVVKAAKAGNAALVGLDLANTLYENRDNIHDVSDAVKVVSDLVQNIPNQVVEDAKAVANAIASGNLVTVGNIALDYTPVPVITRTVDNVANALGYQTNVTKSTKEAVKTVSEAVQNTAKSAVSTAKSVVDRITRWFK